MQEFRATSATLQSATRPPINAYFLEESEITQGSANASSQHLDSFDRSLPRQQQSKLNYFTSFEQSFGLSGNFAQTKTNQADKRLAKTLEKKEAKINKVLPKYRRCSFERISPLNIQPHSMEADMLIQLAQKADRSKRESWVKIGQKHGGRPVYQVIRSWLALQLPNQSQDKKRRWLPEEDLLLEDFASICGGISRSVVNEQQFPGRLHSKLYNRWIRRRETMTCIAPSTSNKMKSLYDLQPRKVAELKKSSTLEPKILPQASVPNLESLLAQTDLDLQFQSCLKDEHSNFDSILRKEEPVNETVPIMAEYEFSLFQELHSNPSKANMATRQQVTPDATYNDLGNSFSFDDIRPKVSDTFEMKRPPTLTRQGTAQTLATSKLPQSFELSERHLLYETEESFDIQAKIQDDFQCLDELVGFPSLFDRIDEVDCTQYEPNEETFIAIIQAEKGRSDKVYCLPKLRAALQSQS